MQPAARVVGDDDTRLHLFLPSVFTGRAGRACAVAAGPLIKPRVCFDAPIRGERNAHMSEPTRGRQGLRNRRAGDLGESGRPSEDVRREYWKGRRGSGGRCTPGVWRYVRADVSVRPSEVTLPVDEQRNEEINK